MTKKALMDAEAKSGILAELSSSTQEADSAIPIGEFVFQ